MSIEAPCFDRTRIYCEFSTTTLYDMLIILRLYFMVIDDLVCEGIMAMTFFLLLFDTTLFTTTPYFFPLRSITYHRT